MEKRSESNRNDYILLFLLISFAVGIFVWEILSPPAETTQREGILFKAFELLFSIAIGWVLQRIQSRDDFRKSIKQFAISAYRRILDIEKAVSRLSGVLIDDAINRSPDEVIRMRALSKLVEGISDTVNSSAADWADILDEEIKKKDKIQELEEQRIILENSLRIESRKTDEVYTKVNLQLKNLTGEINRLKSELPQMLRSDLASSEDVYPREGRFSSAVYSYYDHSVQAQACIILMIYASFELSAQNWERVKNYNTFYFFQEGGMSKLIYSVRNEAESVGFVINPFNEIYVNDFTETISYFLNAAGRLVDRDYGKDLLIEGIEVLDNRPFGETNAFYIKVRVDADRLPKG